MSTINIFFSLGSNNKIAVNQVNRGSRLRDRFAIAPLQSQGHIPFKDSDTLSHWPIEESPFSRSLTAIVKARALDWPVLVYFSDFGAHSFVCTAIGDIIRDKTCEKRASPVILREKHSGNKEPSRMVKRGWIRRRAGRYFPSPATPIYASSNPATYNILFRELIKRETS